MERAIAEWSSARPSLSPDVVTFLRKLEKSYVVYGDMALLPSTAFADSNDTGIVSGIPQDDLRQLYDVIAKHLKITHVATTRPIPPSTQSSGSEKENVLRAPTNFKPLYGDFGLSVASSPPTQADFDEAYWVTAKQNGIYQTWAPRWTMFSRGNISEKARLLTLPSVLNAVAEGDEDGRGCCAVDLYVGIGYFAFSYLKAGVSKVVGFDLNPWSIEGLMKGAEANRWEARLMSDQKDVDEGCRDADVRLLIFNEDNALAGAVVDKMRAILPPVRHVNCGLLPTSNGSWRTAVEVLNPFAGGWIHVHENFAVDEIEAKAEEVRREMQQIVDEVRGGISLPGKRVSVEGINRLKSYAPGVIHCVLDVYVPAYAGS